MYKGFTESSPEGYVAKEFDKIAPAPGVDWNGQPKDWLELSSRNGWKIGTAATNAKMGSIIIVADQAGQVLVGIVRDVNDAGICFETLGQRNQLLRQTVDYHALGSDYKLIGYIWPERTQRMKLVLGS